MTVYTNDSSKTNTNNSFFTDPEKDSNYIYNLIGVVVHTGTAEGGHYYSFIRDRTSGQSDRWFLFNDAEVKPFDPQQIASECFGGEMMVRLNGKHCLTPG